MSKILIHDLEESFENTLNPSSEIQIINARHAYAACKGCFGCWLRTPGVCIMKDKIHNIGASVMQADEVILISRCVYGGFSPEVKKVWDRCIPGILPFFSFRDGKMHHAKRYSHGPTITTVFYGETTPQEKLLAKKINKGNCVNFSAKSSTIKFVDCFEQIHDEVTL